MQMKQKICQPERVPRYLYDSLFEDTWQASRPAPSQRNSWLPRHSNSALPASLYTKIESDHHADFTALRTSMLCGDKALDPSRNHRLLRRY